MSSKKVIQKFLRLTKSQINSELENGWIIKNISTGYSSGIRNILVYDVLLEKEKV